MNEGNTSSPSNVAGAGYSNGSTSIQSQRVPSVGVTNGNKAPAAALNGSANHGVREARLGSQSGSATYFGHDREEVTRLLIQTLTDMGYQTAAESVSRQSNFALESPTVAAFRSAVLSGSWREAEDLLLGAASSDAPGNQGNGLVLAHGSDRNVMKFWLRQQKFLELLEQRDSRRALAVLRGELTPLSHETQRLHFLSSLLMCESTEVLKAKASWDGADGNSRRLLLSELAKCISPSVMLPENRLAVLLNQVKQGQIDTCLYHTAALSPSLYSDHSCERRNFPTDVALELTNLSGEVWEIRFSHDGSKLAACGSKEQVIIWDTRSFSVLHTFSDHENGVGNISWSPDDTMLVTCSQDKHACLWDVTNGTLLKKFKQFNEPVSGCVWSQDGQSFTLGTLGQTQGICTVDIHKEELRFWGKKHRVQDICGSKDGRWLVVVDDAQNIHVYNAFTQEVEYEMELKERPTSISISLDSRHLLVNRKDGEAQLIDLLTRNAVQKFFGHTGGEYLIRSSFGGANESFVVSGSEDGNILIWHKNSGAAVERLPAHRPRCNSVSWNPQDPCMLASCGDDGKVKIWSNKANCLDIRSRFQRNNGWRVPEHDE